MLVGLAQVWTESLLVIYNFLLNSFFFSFLGWPHAQQATTGVNEKKEEEEAPAPELMTTSVFPKFFGKKKVNCEKKEKKNARGAFELKTKISGFSQKIF